MVKTELGPDAMIISSTKEKRKGLLGFFLKPVFRVTAAVGPPPARRYPVGQDEDKPADTTRDEFRRSMLEPLARELRELRSKVDTLLRSKEPPAGIASDASEKETESGLRDFQVSGISEERRRELNSILPDSRGETSGIARPAFLPSLPEAPPDPGQLGRISAALHDAGVGEAAILALVEKVKSSEAGSDEPEDLGKRLKDAVESTVRCCGTIRMKRNGPRIVALVGPTGVGKTTTVAKLAARFTVGRKAKIALVTIDTFRVGAVEQLKTYSRIMGLPLEVASTPKELEKAISLHSDKDLILIDTVGRSPKDYETIENLKEMLSVPFSIETHLCVAATTRERELRSIVESFSVLPISRLLFTKLDESFSFGAIINLQLEKKLPLSFFTKGQRVPEDIEPATGKKVAELVLGEG
jgi:flagellar biosynthesis protein FlhF